jgi:TRAP-type uncharacterized transport system fused permease subunit
MPACAQSLRERWPTLIPLVLLITILVSGRTPYLAAFTGITLVRHRRPDHLAARQPRRNWALLAGCMALMVLVFGGIDERHQAGIFGRRRGATGGGLMRRAEGRGPHRPPALVEAFETGAKYALAVGAAAATVGIVIGVVTLTGVGFKLSTIITGAAQAVAGGVGMLVPAALAAPDLTLLVALVMTGLVCILLGCGIPTTANYIIMVTVAAPTLVQWAWSRWWRTSSSSTTACWPTSRRRWRWRPMPPRAWPGSDPFKTGNTAFRLGLAKALVPFVFVFSPSLLIVAKGFTWPDFVVTFTGCVLGITLLAAALSKFFLVEMKRFAMPTKTFTSGRIRRADYDPATRQLDLHWDNKTVLAYKPVPEEVFRRISSAPYPASYWEDRIADEYPKATPMKSEVGSAGPKTLGDLFGSGD